MLEYGLVVLGIALLSLLAFANGSNDVSKSIATLTGARLATIDQAVVWGTIWTFAGGLAGLVWSEALVSTILHSFYTDQHVIDLPLTLSVVLATASWVILATWLRLPVSTTHSIVGALVGSGLVAYGWSGIAWGTTFSKLIVPLLASPVIAIVLAYYLTPYLVSFGRKLGDLTLQLPVPLKFESERYGTSTVEAKLFSIDQLHWLTSGMLSFSRGLNDTPKLIAITLPIVFVSDLTPPAWIFIVAALAMAIGSIVAGRRVTQVLGFEVTPMSNGQGFSANLIAALLVIGASRFGMPVSTTHVSASAIMGLGLTKGGKLNHTTVKSMLSVWVVTAPATGLLAIAIYVVLSAV